jgi:hypothetical protein
MNGGQAGKQDGVDALDEAWKARWNMAWNRLSTVLETRLECSEDTLPAVLSLSFLNQDEHDGGRGRNRGRTME